LCQFAAASTAAIQALIDRGVVVRELRTFDDGTPLHAAGVVTMRDAAVFDMLVNVCGTGLEVRHRIDGTCLHSAARTMNVFAVRWLLNAGADANSLSSNGSTPLHNVVDRDCAVSLLAAGANVCARDNRGRTALQRVMPIEMAAVHPLIAAGADLDAVDNDGKTARQMLARRGWTSDPDKVEVAPRHCQDATRLCALSRDSSVHWSSIAASQCVANVRNPAVCVRRPRCAVDSVSHLVEDCHHSEALSIKMNSMKPTASLHLRN
jgi:hypothetical protein